jgi:hypothetical protein
MKKTKGYNLSKKYNWKPVPDKFIRKNGEPGGLIKEIPIGTENPVLAFKEWKTKYWTSESILAQTAGKYEYNNNDVERFRSSVINIDETTSELNKTSMGVEILTDFLEHNKNDIEIILNYFNIEHHVNNPNSVFRLFTFNILMLQVNNLSYFTESFYEEWDEGEIDTKLFFEKLNDEIKVIQTIQFFKLINENL